MAELQGRRLSVVVGCVDCVRTIDDSLGSILASCAGLDADVVVVDASMDGTAARVRAGFPGVRLIEARPHTLVPELWARGIAESSGEAVALTIGHCVVPEGWASSLLQELEGGAAGAGGPIDLSPESSATDRALYLLRYSAFLPGTGDASGGVPDIAGDNAAYRRAVLVPHEASWRDGFWEIDFHRRLTTADGGLRMVPAAIAEFRPHAMLSHYARQRLAHGRHFGGWRVREKGEPAWRVVAAAPFVPFVLLTRIGMRVWSRRAFRSRFFTALPRLLILAVAWAAGEAWGALGEPRRDTTGSRSGAQTH